jgi:rhodanese-related sulfurtransferase
MMRPPPPEIDVREADRRRSGAGPDGPLMVDVREPSEFAETRADDVALLPTSTFVARFQELPQARPLMLICRSGVRSGQATTFLLANGWTDVVNVAGGMLAWEAAGLPVRRGVPVPGEGSLPPHE